MKNLLLKKINVKTAAYVVAIILIGFGGYFIGSRRNKNIESMVQETGGANNYSGIDNAQKEVSASAENSAAAIQQQASAEKHYCAPESRNLPSGCSRLMSSTCAHRFAKYCTDSPCAFSAGSPCWACNDPKVEYWTEGRCQ